MDPILADRYVDDEDLVTIIVDKIKSDGIFDQLRSNLLSEIEEKPSYKNLKHRVDNEVSHILDIESPNQPNKMKLRDQMRARLTKTKPFDAGLDTLLSQSLQSAKDTIIKPAIDSQLFTYLGVSSDEWAAMLNDLAESERPGAKLQAAEDAMAPVAESIPSILSSQFSNPPPGLRPQLASASITADITPQAPPLSMASSIAPPLLPPAPANANPFLKVILNNNPSPIGVELLSAAAAVANNPVLSRYFAQLSSPEKTEKLLQSYEQNQRAFEEQRKEESENLKEQQQKNQDAKSRLDERIKKERAALAAVSNTTSTSESAPASEPRRDDRPRRSEYDRGSSRRVLSERRNEPDRRKDIRDREKKDDLTADYKRADVAVKMEVDEADDLNVKSEPMDTSEGKRVAHRTSNKVRGDADTKRGEGKSRTDLMRRDDSAREKSSDRRTVPYGLDERQSPLKDRHYRGERDDRRERVHATRDRPGGRDIALRGSDRHRTESRMESERRRRRSSRTPNGSRRYRPEDDRRSTRDRPRSSSTRRDSDRSRRDYHRSDSRRRDSDRRDDVGPSRGAPMDARREHHDQGRDCSSDVKLEVKEESSSAHDGPVTGDATIAAGEKGFAFEWNKVDDDTFSNISVSSVHTSELSGLDDISSDESSVSDEHMKMDHTKSPVKRKRSPNSRAQASKYDVDELYKPRRDFGSRRRRGVAEAADPSDQETNPTEDAASSDADKLTKEPPGDRTNPFEEPAKPLDNALQVPTTSESPDTKNTESKAFVVSTDETSEPRTDDA